MVIISTDVGTHGVSTKYFSHSIEWLKTKFNFVAFTVEQRIKSTQTVGIFCYVIFVFLFLISKQYTTSIRRDTDNIFSECGYLFFATK